MTQQEFEKLTSMTVTAEEYSQIEKVYMADVNIDKRKFCEMWKNTPEPAQNYMIKVVNGYEKSSQKLSVVTNDRNSLLDIMFERAQVMADPVLRAECIKHMGAKEYIMKLMSSEHKIWEADKELIAEIMANII